MTADSTAPAEESADCLRPAKNPAAKAVTVHAGARDSYQLARGMSEAGILERLVTDLYWPGDRGWAKLVEPRLNANLRQLVFRRFERALPSQQVVQLPLQGLKSLALDRMQRIPFETRRRATRAADAALGREAGQRARQTGAGLVTYSYVGYDAIKAYGLPAMLFQVHPHPATVRRLLREELAYHPECASSLQQEWELALPENDYQRLAAEPAMASTILVASTFTRTSLIENGIAPSSVTVVPYGVDLERFRPLKYGKAKSSDEPLHLLFVGRINQRKGISYLLEAIRQFSPEEVRLTVCGRVVDNLELFRDLTAQVEVRPSVSSEDLVSAYQQADLFVFPSIAEGFGQVLLEALACGLPILSTTHTAAPDLIADNVEGFIVEPRDVSALTDRIRWALNHRSELSRMGVAARERAEHFTWAKFRKSSSDVVRSYLATRSIGR